MPRPTIVPALLASLLLLASSFAFAHQHDPVLIELGARRERASTVLDRFDIAVRGLAAGQGMAYDEALLAQVYPFLPQFLEQRGTELVLLEAARVRGVVVDDDVIEGVVAGAREQFPDEASFLEILTIAGFRDLDQLRAVARETETIDALIAVIEAEVVLSELEVRVGYEALKPQLTQPAQVCARHILVEDEAQAVQVAEAIRGGTDFSVLAAAVSIDQGSAASGGELGCFAMGMMVAEFEGAAFAAAVGEVTEPVRSSFGYHLILVDERLPAQARSLEEVREPLEQQLIAERVQATIAALVEFSGVRTYPDRIPPLAAPSDGGN